MKQVNIIERYSTWQFIIDAVDPFDTMTESKDFSIIERGGKLKRITPAAGIIKHGRAKFPGDTDGISQV